MTSDAITACYQGDHRLCLSQSTVCIGDSDTNWLVKSEYLSNFCQIKGENRLGKSITRLYSEPL